MTSPIEGPKIRHKNCPCFTLWCTIAPSDEKQEEINLFAGLVSVYTTSKLSNQSKNCFPKLFFMVFFFLFSSYSWPLSRHERSCWYVRLSSFTPDYNWTIKLSFIPLTDNCAWRTRDVEHSEKFTFDWLQNYISIFHSFVAIFCWKIEWYMAVDITGNYDYKPF
jgi:hypothetical protein